MNNDKERLNRLKKDSSDRILELLDILQIEYSYNDSEVRAICPIHRGDNSLAWSWSFIHSSWRCWTKSCHDEVGSDVIGLVKGVRHCSFGQAVSFLSGFVRSDIKMPERQATPVPMSSKKPETNIPLIDVIPRIKLDDQYYVNRGLSPETIKKYHIGICNDPKKKFYRRVIIPVLSDDRKYVVGFTARSIYDKCDKCKAHHDPEYTYCPPRPEAFSKWKHSGGFAKSHFLYNYWFSQYYIRQSKTAILVEGPGDCLALEQAGIHNSVGLFGLSLSNNQKSLLQKAGAVHIVLCMDNDDAGKKATRKIKEDLGYYFEVNVMSLNTKDVGEMKTDEIKERVACLTN